MKKFYASLILIILCLHVANSFAIGPKTSTSDIDFTFLFEIEGNGYSLPYRTQFILGFEIIIWYCQDGILKSYLPSYELTMPHLGVSLAFFGIWSAPTLLAQPGELSGFLVGPAVLLTNITQN